MTDETSDDGFTVGYKKPPQHSRFQSGRSGNPRGREKGVRNLGSDVKRTLEVPVRLNEQGRARRVSTQHAVLLRLREKALKGDARSLDRFRGRDTLGGAVGIGATGRREGPGSVRRTSARPIAWLAISDTNFDAQKRKSSL